MAGQNPRRADFYFLLLSSSPCIVGMLFLCCLRIANVQYKCIHARMTCVTTPWVPEKIRVPRIFIFCFCQAPRALWECCFCVVCAIHARRTCVTTPWVAVQNPRRANFHFLLLSSSPCIVGMLFLCCLRIANVQYKCIHARRTCVTTPWVAGKNPRRADFLFFAFAKLPVQCGNVVFVLFAHCQCTIQVHTRT